MKTHAAGIPVNYNVTLFQETVKKIYRQHVVRTCLQQNEEVGSILQSRLTAWGQSMPTEIKSIPIRSSHEWSPL